MSTPIPRRKRFKVSIEETFQTTFTVLAHSQDEAQKKAEEISEAKTYPKDVSESCERRVYVWEEKA